MDASPRGRTHGESSPPDGSVTVDSCALHAFRTTLAMIPAAWALWVLDADERYVVLEGSGLERIGVEAAGLLGKTLAETHSGAPDLVAWGRKYMRDPGTGLAVIGGHTLLLSGAPCHGGGCFGFGILLEAGVPAGECKPGRVLELSRDLPRVGARRGDLLVADVDRPGKVGLYREIDVSLLGWELQQEIRGISPSSCAGAPHRPSRRSDEPSPAHAAHLRLLP